MFDILLVRFRRIGIRWVRAIALLGWLVAVGSSVGFTIDTRHERKRL